MYFITAMTNVITEKNDIRSEEAKNHSTRCFGYFIEETEARKAVVNNYGSMHETMYDFIIIEKIDEGIHSIAEDVAWYKYNFSTNKYEEYEQGRTGFCNYAIG